MGKYYSTDLRERAVNYVLRGGDRGDACHIFEISTSTLQRWISQYSRSGNLSPKPQGSRPWKLNHTEVVEYVKCHSDCTLQEAADHFNTFVSVIDYILRKHKITRKKNHAISRARRAQTVSIQG